MKALHELAAIKYVYLDTCSYRVPYPAAVAMQYALYERVRGRCLSLITFAIEHMT